MKVVAETNAACPISLGSMGMMESVDINEENIIMTMNLDIFNNMLDPSLMKDDSKMDYESVFKTLFSVEPAMNSLMQLLSECNMGLQIDLQVDGKSLRKFSISKEMIDDILMHEPNYKEYVKTMVEITNSKGIINMGPMSQLNVEISNDKVITNILVDENQIDFNALAANSSFIKNGLIEMLRNDSEPVTCMIMKNTALAGYSTVYKYMGSACGKEITIEFTPDEVYDALQILQIEE